MDNGWWSSGPTLSRKYGKVSCRAPELQRVEDARMSVEDKMKLGSAWLVVGLSLSRADLNHSQDWSLVTIGVDVGAMSIKSTGTAGSTICWL